MDTQLADQLVDLYEAGQLTRRQLVTRLLSIGAAAAAFGRPAFGQAPAADVEIERPTFQATGLDHIALDVTDLPRSRAFYQRHLGLRVIRGDDRASFLGADRDFFLTLFQADKPAMNHYCYAIENYDPAIAVDRLTAAGLTPRRTGNRVYFPDPDGLTVQVTGRQRG